MFTNKVLVITVGANGALNVVNAILVSLVVNKGVLPQFVVYPTFIESPIPAAALLLYLIQITLEVNDPESKDPVEPTVPIGNDHE